MCGGDEDIFERAFYVEGLLFRRLRNRYAARAVMVKHVNDHP